MKIITRNFWVALLLNYLLISTSAYSQIVINEITPSNNGSFTDEYKSNPDWVELYNAGATSVNINGYGFSDNITIPLKWTFPDITIPSHGYLIVVTDDTSKKQTTHHWESAVKATDTWKYKIPAAGADTNWRNLSFNDATWTSGTGGVGFGDADDGTSIPTTSVSVYMRKTFTIADTGKITQGVFNMDYDDGFVAYLNGKEIARANLGTAGVRPAYNLLATASHEATLYQGQKPDSFYLSKTFLSTVLVNGTNVLTVETHNNAASSTDLSSNPFLSFGFTDNGTYFSSLPTWFPVPPTEYMHAKFKLDKTGETILLSNAAGTIIDQKTYPNMEIDDSYGRSTDGGSTWCYFETPTAGSTNNSSVCATGYASIPLFSLTGNFYTGSQSLTLTTSQPGGVIRYSRDGTYPTTASTAYSAPINLDTTQVIRAKAFATGLLPSATITNDFFINETTKLPILAITTTPGNLWDYNTGIYVMGPNASTTTPYFGANFWMDWEKPATIEYFDKQKNRVFKFNANVKINGGYSRAKPQKSLEIKMDDKWGTAAIDYALIPDKSFITKWDNWIIRNAGNDWHKAHLRDAALEKNLKNTNASYMGQEPCLGFVNGQFFGVYYLDENDDHNFVKNNYGYKKDEIDFLASNSGLTEIKQGSDSAFNAMYAYATSSSPSGGSYYNTMNGMFDLMNFADYFIAEIYCGNSDWIGDWTNNIKLWRPRTATGKFKYLTYDLDQSAGLNVTYSDNTLTRARRPNSANPFSGMFNKLLSNTQFKQYFINRYADLLNTIFLPTNVLNQKNSIKDSINTDLPRSFTKYGGSVSTWNTELSTFTTFINNRTSNLRNQAQTEFALTGQVTLTLNTSPAGSGHIIISTITPATYPWTGVYFNGNPVTITAVPNPGYTLNYWKSTVAFPVNNTNQTVTQNFTATDAITAYFTGSAASTQITFSEVNYNSASTADAGDWLELWNYGATSLDISAWYIKDENDNHKYTFPAGTLLAANGRLVLATDVAKFQARFPSVSNYQAIDFGFENGGEIIRLYKYDGTLYKSFTYDNAAPWPLTPDGQGYTLELLNQAGNLDDGANWFAGCPGGSPGVAYSAGACCSVTATVTAGGATTFCTGSGVTLTAATGTGYTYQWKKDGINISGATAISYIANTTGAFTCAVTSGTCTQPSNSISVTVNTAPPSTITPAGSTAICTGGSIVLNGNTGTGLTYQWKLNAANISGATASSYTANAAGSYTLSVTNSCGSTTSSATVITVNPLPTATITPAGSTTICSGSSVVLNGNTGTGLTYQWKLNATNISGATAASYTANAAGSYTLVVTNSCGNTTSSATVVTINPLPTATITAGGPTTICTGNTVVLNANTGTGLTYQWKNNGSAISGATAASYTASTSGSYTVTVSNTCGNSTSAATVVTVSGTITATITAGGPTTFCTGGSVLLTASTGTGYTYQWKLNGTNISGATLITYSANTAGSYTVAISNGACTANSSATSVTVNTAPPATATPAGSTQLCGGQTVVINANTGTGLTYQWKLNAANISGATAAAYTASAAGSYTVVVTNSCGSATSAAVVVTTGNITATITAGGATSWCGTGSVLLSSNTGTGYTYQWKKSGTNISGATAATYSATTTGSYTVTITSGACSGSSNAISVSTTAAPVATINPASVSKCATASVVLTANPGGTGYTYQWYKNGSIISASTKQTHTSSTSTSATYTVKVTNACGNNTSAACSVTVNCRETEAMIMSEGLIAEVYPNPFSSRFTVIIKGGLENKAIIRIFDLLGKEKVILDDLRNDEAIEIGEQLSPGVYLLEISAGDQRKMMRVIKTQ